MYSGTSACETAGHAPEPSESRTHLPFVYAQLVLDRRDTFEFQAAKLRAIFGAGSKDTHAAAT